MIKSFGTTVAALSIAVMFAPNVWAMGAGSELTLKGEYRVVATRRASDVSGPPDDMSVQNAAGKSVNFGDGLTWWDGKSCVDWTIATASMSGDYLEDPNLSDTQIGPIEGARSSGDKRRGEHVVLKCGAEVIDHLVIVDERVLISPSSSGLSYIILERELSPEGIKAFQDQLKSMKFLEGETSNTWTDTGRKAVSSYAEYRGATYRFYRAAITQNLLDGLDIPGETD